ncbi:phosphotransferase [Microbacterium sp. CFBP9034]|uniref:phosphotransferase n=1 Tax=Microbacterium sp. CFBP9034 TaxID=3096540 RepID=UPI002A6B85C7|nr:phosphotransferase [Microbacterium sp. CFBP9034]MDY0909445.1 phosphotransferase [Microbacterium sp. CFBP9034]
MPDKPPAEVSIDEALVRHLVVVQAGHAVPDAATLSLTRVTAGWDSDIWRLGQDVAVRLPRRALAAPLILNEHRSLPLIGPHIEATGVRVPLPLVLGVPAEGFPWHWSVVPWIDGARGMDVPRTDRHVWAAPLAAALAAMHVGAGPGFPVNPVRGHALETRTTAFEDRLRTLLAATLVSPSDAAALAARWDAGIAASPWAGPPVWIHGDLHPGNLVAGRQTLAGIIDFGDVTAGDPAYDLAVAWLAFDATGRERFVSATRRRYDAATWLRAHAWAAAVAVMLLAHSDDDPDYAALGRESVREVVGPKLSG